MKHSSINTFPLAGKKRIVKLIPHNFNHGFQQQKKAPNKSTLFLLDIKYVSTGRKEGFVENMFSIDVKITFSGNNVC